MLLSASSNTHGSTLTSSAIQTLVHAFICTRVDFANSLLYGTSAYLLDRLQSVLNSAARLILRIGKYDPISAAIRRNLHWLPVPFRIRYKLNSITSNCLAGRAPEYLIELCHSMTDIPAKRNLRSSSQVQLLVPRYRKERSGKRGFSVSSPQLWNLLPADIRLLHNEHQLSGRDSKLTIYVKFKVKESIADIPTELPCPSDLQNKSQLPVREVLVIQVDFRFNTYSEVLVIVSCRFEIFEISSLFKFFR